jgi:hypothetical protein
MSVIKELHKPCIDLLAITEKILLCGDNLVIKSISTVVANTIKKTINEFVRLEMV